MNEGMLTTVDNPFNPFTQFDDWKRFDEDKGYYTCEYLARIAMTSHALSDEEESEEIEAAMKEILKIHALGFYKIVRKSVIN
jgi:hypothetical protein